MTRHGRILGPLLVMACCTPAAAQPASNAVAMQRDASLAQVFFGDAQRGWAVGDRGVIWHTDDGGRRWRLQASGVDDRLTSIHFTDADNGWAVGRKTRPYTHTTEGILLRTRNGGQTWQKESTAALPGLNYVKFFDEQRGVALGDSSALFPSGVFTTKDGGRRWSAVPAQRVGGWLTGDFSDRNVGVLAGSQGALASMWRRSIKPSRIPALGLRSVRRVKLLSARDGWLVGDGGLILRTTDSGVSWQTPPTAIPQRVTRHFDFSAVAGVGSHCWIAGSPGTLVFHSADGGRSWESFPTRQNLPIHSLTFVDQQHGWAVGALGTILASVDGGRTWKRQAGGGTRAALLGLFSRPQHVPLEAFAQLSGNDGYLGVVAVLNRQDVEAASPRMRAEPQRTHEALMLCGASQAETAWAFPLRQTGLKLSLRQIVAGLDEASDGRGLDLLQQHIVRQIRMWRPNVILTHSADPDDTDPLSHLINQIVLKAVKAAGDGTRYSEQITDAGLRPYAPQKVFGLLRDHEPTAVTLSTGKLAPRLGRSPADQAAPARGLVANRYRPSESTIDFRLLWSDVPDELAQRGIFGGILLQPGGEARRELSLPVQQTIDTLRRQTQLKRNLQQMLTASDDDRQAGGQWLAQAASMTRGLDGPLAGRVLYQLARRYHRHGRWEMAAETFALLVERHPDHPLAEAAMVWLVQYYASSEAAWRVQGRQRFVSQVVKVKGEILPEVRASENRAIPTTVDRPHGNVRQVQGLSVDESKLTDRPARAAEWSRRLKQLRPEAFARPSVQFPLAAAQRQRGLGRQAERFYFNTVSRRPHDVWWENARTQQWLAEPKGVAPKWVHNCYAAGTKPRLDGKLDDAAWRGARVIQLRSARSDDDAWGAEAMISYDADFLYLAVRCKKAAGAKYPASSGPRPRDADLSDHDRVDFYIDLDRDHATYFRLTVDHRGWTGEGCWGDRTWNPNWFVASGGEEGTWTAEAAIPLDQLTGIPPRPGHIWSLGIQRTVPGVGFQSASQPAAIEVKPEGFGYLVFN